MRAKHKGTKRKNRSQDSELDRLTELVRRDVRTLLNNIDRQVATEVARQSFRRRLASFFRQSVR